jgi:hypothetical protein
MIPRGTPSLVPPLNHSARHRSCIDSDTSASMRCGGIAPVRSQRIVDSIPKPLLASQIALRRLNADVPEQGLNLLQFSACFVAQAGARATRVVGRHTSQRGRTRSRLASRRPRSPSAEAMRSNPSRLVDCAKDRTGGDLRLRDPGAQACLDPEWNRHGPDVTTFANEVSKDPVLFAL